MSLVMPALRRKDLVVTNLTSLPRVHDIFKRLGFRTLETFTRVHPIWPSLGSTDFDVRFGEAIEPVGLPGNQGQVHEAHRGIAGTVAISGPEGICYVVYTISRFRGLRTARLHHVAPRDGLSWSLYSLQLALFRRHAAVLLAYDRRLATNAKEPYRDFPLTPARIYRGDNLAPEDLTNAFSETVLLNI